MMFVRWKNRACKDWGAWHGRVDRTFSAYLVKSVRVNGKPRQKVVAFLASVREFALDCPWTSGEEKARRNRTARALFWEQVEARLTHVVLTEKDRQHLVASLTQVVPQLTAEEQTTYEAEEARHQLGFTSMLQMPGRG